MGFVFVRPKKLLDYKFGWMYFRVYVRIIPDFITLHTGLHSQGGYWEDSPFESNFSWGFWFGSSTGLRYMHGAGSQL